MYITSKRQYRVIFITKKLTKLQNIVLTENCWTYFALES
jgi:hypothetical protein